MPTIKYIVDQSDQAASSEDDPKVMTSRRGGGRSAAMAYYFVDNGDFGIVWTNVYIFIVGHLLYAYSHYILWTEFPWKTWVFSYWVGTLGGLGITAGAHRLWSHKSYSAKLPLRIALMIGQCIAGQNCLFSWCRDHRVHHKFAETDGDPHNTNRGFFFAHVGWLLRKKHPYMLEKSRTLDFSDLLRDPVIRFQKDFYFILYFVFAVFGPILVPMFLWNETFWRSFLLCYVSRYVTSLHCTWFVNSTAHMFGDRPYNEKIQPRENYWVSYGAFGEGYHNYHHTFPWDYATAELGSKINPSKVFIEWMADLGLAYDLKKPSDSMVESRKHMVRISRLHHHSDNHHVGEDDVAIDPSSPGYYKAEIKERHHLHHRQEVAIGH